MDISGKTYLKDEITGNPSICAKCSYTGETCCHCLPGDEEMATPVSNQERDRMIAANPLLASPNLIVQVGNTERFVEQMHRLFPGRSSDVTQLFPLTGTHYRLGVAPQRQCALLGERGCLLPLQIRPLFCRIYPFWFNGLDQPHIFSYDQCLALQEYSTVLELCTSLGSNPEKLRQLYVQLCQAWGFDLSTTLQPVCN